MERVQAIHGKSSIILVCPHGADDTHTGSVTAKCAEELGCHAVINWGFERDYVVDVVKDKADCNKIDHVEQDVVREEFLNPILKMRRRIDYLTPQGKSPYCYIFYIHGFGMQVEAAYDSKIDLILGYGESHLNPSLTCPHWVVDKLIFDWEDAADGMAYCGEPGGRYSARSANNMCQYFTKRISDSFVRSVQIEISQRLRTTKLLAEWTGHVLAQSLRGIPTVDHFDNSFSRVYV